MFSFFKLGGKLLILLLKHEDKNKADCKICELIPEISKVRQLADHLEAFLMNKSFLFTGRKSNTHQLNHSNVYTYLGQTVWTNLLKD